MLAVLGFCAGTRGFIGLTCEVVALETTCFLGEIAFAVALDLTGRAVTVGFVTGRDTAVGRVVMAVLTVVPDRVCLVTEEATAGRILVVPSP